MAILKTPLDEYWENNPAPESRLDPEPPKPWQRYTPTAGPKFLPSDLMPTGSYEPEPPEDFVSPTTRGDFGAGWEEGVEGWFALTNAAIGAGLSLIGADDMAQSFINDYHMYNQRMEEMQRADPNRVRSWDDIWKEDPRDETTTLGRMTDWFFYTLGQAAPYAAESISTAIVGAAIGSLIAPGPGTAAGALGGKFITSGSAKLLARKTVRDAAEGWAKDEAGRQAKDMTYDMLRDQVKRYVRGEEVSQYVEDFAKDSVKLMMGRAGLFASGYKTGVGDLYGESIEAGSPDEVNSFGLAIPYALADVFVEGKVLDKFFSGSKAGTGVLRSLKSGAAGALQYAPLEGLAEASQEALLLLQRSGIDEDFRVFGEEGLARIRNSFAAGAAVGATMGAASGAFGKPRTEYEGLEDIPPPESTPPPVTPAPDLPPPQSLGTLRDMQARRAAEEWGGEGGTVPAGVSQQKLNDFMAERQGLSAIGKELQALRRRTERDAKINALSQQEEQLRSRITNTMPYAEAIANDIMDRGQSIAETISRQDTVQDAIDVATSVFEDGRYQLHRQATMNMANNMRRKGERLLGQIRSEINLTQLDNEIENLRRQADYIQMAEQQELGRRRAETLSGARQEVAALLRKEAERTGKPMQIPTLLTQTSGLKEGWSGTERQRAEFTDEALRAAYNELPTDLGQSPGFAQTSADARADALTSLADAQSRFSGTQNKLLGEIEKRLAGAQQPPAAAPKPAPQNKASTKQGSAAKKKAAKPTQQAPKPPAQAPKPQAQEPPKPAKAEGAGSVVKPFGPEDVEKRKVSVDADDQAKEAYSKKPKLIYVSDIEGTVKAYTDTEWNEVKKGVSPIKAAESLYGSPIPGDTAKTVERVAERIRDANTRKQQKKQAPVKEPTEEAVEEQPEEAVEEQPETTAEEVIERSLARARRLREQAAANNKAAQQAAKPAAAKKKSAAKKETAAKKRAAQQETEKEDVTTEQDANEKAARKPKVPKKKLRRGKKADAIAFKHATPQSTNEAENAKALANLEDELTNYVTKDNAPVTVELFLKELATITGVKAIAKNMLLLRNKITQYGNNKGRLAAAALKKWGEVADKIAATRSKPKETAEQQPTNAGLSKRIAEVRKLAANRQKEAPAEKPAAATKTADRTKELEQAMTAKTAAQRLVESVETEKDIENVASRIAGNAKVYGILYLNDVVTGLENKFGKKRILIEDVLKAANKTKLREMVGKDGIKDLVLHEDRNLLYRQLSKLSTADLIKGIAFEFRAWQRRTKRPVNGGPEYASQVKEAIEANESGLPQSGVFQEGGDLAESGLRIYGSKGGTPQQGTLRTGQSEADQARENLAKAEEAKAKIIKELEETWSIPATDRLRLERSINNYVKKGDGFFVLMTEDGDLRINTSGKVRKAGSKQRDANVNEMVGRYDPKNWVKRDFGVSAEEDIKWQILSDLLTYSRESGTKAKGALGKSKVTAYELKNVGVREARDPFSRAFNKIRGEEAVFLSEAERQYYPQGLYNESPTESGERLLTNIEKDIVWNAVSDLAKAGVPVELINSVKKWTVAELESDLTPMQVTIQGKKLTINSSYMERLANIKREPSVNDQLLFRWHLAHELAHVLDDAFSVGNKTAPGIAGNSANSAFRADADSYIYQGFFGDWEIDTDGWGDAAKELADMFVGNKAGTNDILDYPFGTWMTWLDTEKELNTDSLSAEIFAQGHALYVMFPSILEQHAPTAYAIYERIRDDIDGSKRANDFTFIADTVQKHVQGGNSSRAVYAGQGPANRKTTRSTAEERANARRGPRPRGRPLTPEQVIADAAGKLKADAYADATKGVERGLQDRGSVTELAKQTFQEHLNGFTRAFKGLDKTRFSKLIDILTRARREPEEAMNTAMMRYGRIVAPLSSSEYRWYAARVMFDDLKYNADEGKPIPFGLSKDEFYQIHNEVKARTDANSRIKRAVESRDKLIKEHANMLVETGVMDKKHLKEGRPYFHNMLMEDALIGERRMKSLFAGAGRKTMKLPQPLYAKLRKGTEGAINANVLEVDLFFLSRSMADAEWATAIREIAKWYHDADQIVKDKNGRYKGVQPGYKAIKVGKGVRLIGTTIPELATDQQLEAAVQQMIAAGASEADARLAVDQLLAQDAAETDNRGRLILGWESHRDPTIVVPEEVADAMNNLHNQVDRGALGRMVTTPVRMWKQWVLLNPRRAFKYNINNFAGDLDAVLAAYPRAFKKVGQAYRVLKLALDKNLKEGSPELALWMEAMQNGVLMSGYTINEVEDLRNDSRMRQLLSAFKDENVLKRGLNRYWFWVKDWTNLREDLFRLASYISYKEELDSGKKWSDLNLGVADETMMSSLAEMGDNSILAAYMSRELLGDYGNISEYGQELRQTAIPFYSWLHINTVRYNRLFKNSAVQIARGNVAKGTLLVARAGILYGLVSMWNNMFFPEEEDKLDEYQKRQLHVLFGTNDQGEIISLRAQGALSDYLGWLELTALPEMYADYLGDRATGKDIVYRIMKAPVNRLVQGLTPVIKTPVEMAIGARLYPDFTKPIPSKDSLRDALATWSAENEYDMLTGKPTRGYANSWIEAFVYKRDPGEISLNRTYQLSGDWIKNLEGRSGYERLYSDRRLAMYNYRRAVRFGDTDAMRKYMAEMAKYGIDAKSYEKSVKASRPLGVGWNNEKRKQFLKSLSYSERAAVDFGMWYYDRTFGVNPFTNQKIDLRSLDEYEAAE